MKKVLLLVLLSVLTVILDNSLMPFLSIKGFYPSLLFSFIICYSIIDGTWNGLWIGIFSGILQDIYFFSGFGINTLVNMLMCVIAGLIGNSIFKEKSLIPIVSSFVLSLLKGVIVYAILYIAKQYIYFDNIVYNSIYTMAVTIPMYRFVYKLCQKEYMQKKWKF